MTPRERTQRHPPSGTASRRKENLDEVVILRLADLADRLPTDLLKPANHDGTQTLTFEITEIAKQISEGRPNIELAEIYRRLPGIFAREVKASENLSIRFPWQKLVELLRAAASTRPMPGLTRTGALHLARLLRGQRSSFADKAFGKMAAGAIALARAPQWFTRNIESLDSTAEGERILNDLASNLEQFVPGDTPEANFPGERIESSDALAIATEENARLRQEIDERDKEIESLRRTLSELESAAIDQIAALNQQCEEYETATKAKVHSPVHPPAEQAPLNSQQTAMIESLSTQVAELYTELDRVREDGLQATAAHAKYRTQIESSETAATQMQQYLASVAYELERANAVLKEMEAKTQNLEKTVTARDAEIQRLTQEQIALRNEHADLSVERDALRGRLYAMSPGQPLTTKTGTEGRGAA
jgi:predicted  nucleic acid-binding Zn-ribbon protein